LNELYIDSFVNDGLREFVLLYVLSQLTHAPSLSLPHSTLCSSVAAPASASAASFMHHAPTSASAPAPQPAPPPPPPPPPPLQQTVPLINTPQQQPPPPPPPPAQPVAYPSATQKEKLESALDFLDQVKTTFETRPEVYNQFLDIMKEFKVHKYVSRKKLNSSSLSLSLLLSHQNKTNFIVKFIFYILFIFLFSKRSCFSFCISFSDSDSARHKDSPTKIK
jgi:hypothetical protein